MERLAYCVLLAALLSVPFAMKGTAVKQMEFHEILLGDRFRRTFLNINRGA